MESQRQPGAGFGGAGGPNGFGTGRTGTAFARVTRTYTAWRAAPSWAQRALGTLVLLMVVGLAAVLLVVGLTVGAVVAVVVGAVLLVRSAWARLTSGRAGADPGRGEFGLDPLRSNVRVIRRDDASENAGSS